MGTAITILLPHLGFWATEVLLFLLGAILFALITVHRIQEREASQPSTQRSPLWRLFVSWQQAAVGFGTVVFLAVPVILPRTVPCPPTSPTFFGEEYILMEARSGSEPWRLNKARFRPPGSTGARGARITVGKGAGSILWSDDGSKPSHLAEPGDDFWICGERIPKFRASLRSRTTAALLVSYVW